MSVRQLFYLWLVISAMVGVPVLLEYPEILSTLRAWIGIGLYVLMSLGIFMATEFWAWLCVPRPGDTPQRPRPITTVD